jgi:hypothetical protein
MEEDTKERLKLWSYTSVIIFVIGFSLSTYFCIKYFDLKITESIKTQRMLHKGVVYDIMPFDRTGK